MRKILAITVALMFAALVLSPAMGYTIQTAGNQSYTVQSAGDRQYSAHSEAINYTVSSGTPAHELTLESIPTKTVSGPAVQTTKVASSFKAGRVVPYTVTLGTGAKAVSEGVQVAKEPASLGEQTTPAATTAPAAETPVVEAAPATETAAVEAPAAETAAPVEEPKFSIMGTVFDDANGNGVMDENETGLADWTVALGEPAGAVLANATTSETGSYAFADLLAGEYVVSEVVPMGWALIAPVDGKYMVNLTVDAAGLDFANQMLPAPEPAVNETFELEMPPENITIPEQPVA
ncbi:MAG: hypothetical protein HPY61_01035 [Methanotrichaceae archaeon]|nr:hypothetical protein [Methanotrichaceae archaeon]